MEVSEGMDRLSARGDEERHLKGEFRLSCRARIAAEDGVVRCHTLRRGRMAIERRAFQLPASGAEWTLDPAVTRVGDRVLLEGVEVGRSDVPVHGLAVDVGTTTVVLRLLNIETGETVADSSFENPQRFGGSDVMSRIAYDTEDGTSLLRRTLIGYLNHAIEELPVDPGSIFEVVVAGNSTMRDLFFGLTVYPIGQSPYQSVTETELADGSRTSTSLSTPAEKLGLVVNPQARVYGLPLVAGHVGADAAACMLAVDIPHEERHVAVMDIGTNTELVVGNCRKVLAASCPAGPAFEGGQIRCGMPALPGAIDKLSIDDDGSVCVSVIGAEQAEGLCGSGLVDLLSELLRTGRMNALGRFSGDAGDFVVQADEERPVVFTESDVNALAQAKGANVAGLQIAFQRYGIRFDDLDVLYLAGGFGRHLDVASAKRIGLIPNIPDDRVVQIGNGSIEGATIALLSKTKRREIESFVRGVSHCRLETHPAFFDYFVEGCQFAPVEHCAGPTGGLPGKTHV